MRNKTFDCVAMKQEIQQRLRERHADRSWKQRNATVRALLLADPHLSKLLQSPAATIPEKGLTRIP